MRASERASERAIVKEELEFRMAESSCDDHRGYTLVDVQSKNDDDDSEAQRNVGWGKITTQSRWARTPRILLFCRISPSAFYLRISSRPTHLRKSKERYHPTTRRIPGCSLQGRLTSPVPKTPPFPSPPLSESITGRESPYR